MRRRTPTPGGRGASAHGRAAENERTRIAQSAASLIVEGLNDYFAARSKAAAALGVARGTPLPDVEEIDAAVAAHLNLFAADGHAALLRGIRQAALDFLRRADGFHPRLYGPVLTGTATRFSAIEIELGIDTGENKAFEFFLLDAGWPHEVTRAAPTSSLIYEIDTGDATIRAVLAGRHWQHASPHWRARANSRALADLLGGDCALDPVLAATGQVARRLEREIRQHTVGTGALEGEQ